MIGYNRLGSNGRLGNQMFQYASLRGIAYNNNLNWTIPPQDIQSNSNYGLFDAFKLKSVKESNIGLVPNNWKTIEETNFEFDNHLFNNCPDDINIDGYRQSEKYFKNIENIIREDYEFKDEIYESSKQFIDQFKDEIAFLHIRRGDNVGRPDWYPIPTIDYYEYLIEKYFYDRPILICSDDNDWVNQQKLFKSDNFYICETRLYYDHSVKNGVGDMEKSLIPYYDLCLMSLCTGAIIANSSLSWWGAWLQKNKNKKVIAQDPWFGKKLSFNNIKDLIPDSWIVEKIPDDKIQR